MLPILKISFERWKFNKEYEVYVSTHGRIRLKDKSDYEIKTGEGYCWYYSEERKKQKKDYIIPIHRLVMLTWRPIESTTRMTVDHKDHNRRNNHLSNLAWLTPEENVQRGLDDSIVFSSKVGVMLHTEFQKIKEEKKQKQPNSPVQTSVVKHLLVTVKGECGPYRTGLRMDIKPTEAEIITLAGTLDRALNRADFCQHTFKQICRDIVSGKNSTGSKNYFGFEIRGVKA